MGWTGNFILKKWKNHRLFFLCIWSPPILIYWKREIQCISGRNLTCEDVEGLVTVVWSRFTCYRTFKQQMIPFLAAWQVVKVCVCIVLKGGLGHTYDPLLNCTFQILHLLLPPSLPHHPDSQLQCLAALETATESVCSNWALINQNWIEDLPLTVIYQWLSIPQQDGTWQPSHRGISRDLWRSFLRV